MSDILKISQDQFLGLDFSCSKTTQDYSPNFKDNMHDFLPVEQPDEFESESVHSTGNGRENKVQSCLSRDLTW